MTYDSWQNQGRQQHGWFGHGTSPHDDKLDDPPGPVADDAVFRPGQDVPGLTRVRAPLAGELDAVQLIRQLGAGLRGRNALIALAAAAAMAAAGYGLYELMPDYDPRRIRSVPVVDHPKIVAIVDKKERQLAIAIRGAPGATPVPLTWRLRPVASPSPEDGYPPAFKIEDEDGTEMGAYYSTDEILLSDAGERAVAQAGLGLETRNQEERDLVDNLRALGKNDVEIQAQLDLLRVKRGTRGRRNAGLPPALRSYPRNARAAAIAKNPGLQAAINQQLVSVDDIEAHHLVPMQGVRTYPRLFEAASRAGWRPDEAGNVTAQPDSDEAQQRILNATGQQLGTHFHGHPKWNRMVLERLSFIQDKLDLDVPSLSGPEYEQEAKRRLEMLQDELSRIVPTGHISMRETTRSVA